MTPIRRTMTKKRMLVLATVGLIGVGILTPIDNSSAAPKRGSVRHAGKGKSGPGRKSPGRKTPGRGSPGVGSPGRGRPGASPGRRSGHRHASWHNSRNDYFKFRTINHLIRVGARIITMPHQHTTVVVTGTTYYYAGGIYYVKSGSNYVVVSSPPGAVVYAVPTATTVVYAGSTPYYYHGGTYYAASSEPAQQPPPAESVTTVNVNVTDSSQSATEQTSSASGDTVPTPEVPPMTDDDQSYEVVAPPVGASVPYLPEEATEETVGGSKYFVFEETYYRAFASDGDTIYMVVADPKNQDG